MNLINVDIPHTHAGLRLIPALSLFRHCALFRNIQELYLVDKRGFRTGKGREKGKGKATGDGLLISS
jgi:hypothetical protein